MIYSSGLGLLRRVKEIGSGIKTVVVTILNANVSMEQISQMGVEDFITQPFRIEFIEDKLLKK
ncbi:MAG: hypothetical protein NC923_01485 [Candidatus Omnitrophica bacterium]|nr:hypothetical protein [Candidatus Omnitrophota bacterium]